MKTNADFICLSYQNSDYLIEKELVSSSIFFGNKPELNYSRKATLLDKKITIINFDYLAAEAFNDKGRSDQNMLMKIENNYLETTAEAFVKNIQLSEFKLFGEMLNDYCQKKGILAIRYLENNRIQYLLDINNFLKTFKVTIK